MLPPWRPNALFAAAFIATGTIAAGACSGPAFTNSDVGGSGAVASSTHGGVTSNGGVTGSPSGGTTVSANGGSSESGGDAAADGGRAESGGAAGSSGGTFVAGGGTQATGGTSLAGHMGENGGAPPSGGGGSGGTGGSLGLGGVGGLGLGGLLGTAGARAAKFPSTAMLDDFARNDDALGNDWLGATNEFALRDEQLIDQTDAGQPLVWSKRFGANQEAFATLVSFAEQAREINLVLKSQKPGDGCELLEVMYLPNRSQIGLDMCANGNWTGLTPVSIALQPGDQLGARAVANGEVLVYRNGELVTTFDASSFPYEGGGYIGVNAISIPDNPATWDDFGGGNTAP